MRIALPADPGAAKLGVFVSGLVVLVLVLRLAVPAPAGASAGGMKLAAPAPKAAPLNLTVPAVPPQTAEAINAAQPMAAPTGPAKPFVLTAASEDRSRALTCLTQAIYYEAGFEATKGQEAVAQVVLNRVRDPIFPHTVCGVVFQGSELKTGCQFSFTCDGSLAHAPQPAAWTRSRKVAEQALNGFVLKNVGSATHYHTDWVIPWWQSTVRKVGQIGAHIFYRWPGAIGMPGALNMHYSGNEQTPPKPGLVQSSGVVAAPDVIRMADGRMHASLTLAATAPEPLTPRERLLALSRQGALGAGFDPAKLQAPAPPPAPVPADGTTAQIVGHIAGE